MKLNLLPPEDCKFEHQRFIREDRYKKLAREIFVGQFRQLVYDGGRAEALEQIVELCQTIEEAVYMAALLDKTERFVAKMIVENPELAAQIFIMGRIQNTALIARKEAFLRDMDKQFDACAERLMPE